MTPCTCQYSRSLGTQQGTIYERGLKTLALADSALFLPHVVPFINFNEEEERVFYQDPETLALVLARTWGVLTDNLPDTIRERARRIGTAAENEDTTADLARALEKVDSNNPLVLRWKRETANKAVPPGQAAITAFEVSSVRLRRPLLLQRLANSSNTLQLWTPFARLQSTKLQQT